MTSSDAGASDDARYRGWSRRIWRVAWPIMLTNLTQPVVGAVDTAVAGHLPGPQYLGGVSVAVLVFGFVYWGFGFLRLSTTGLIAQAFGRRDGTTIRAVIGRAAVLGGVLAAALLVLQAPLHWASLLMIDASPAVSAQFGHYFDVRIWSAPATLGNYIVAGALIGLQRTRTALVVQLVIASVNVVLALAFVFGLGWGVVGLAGATTIAEFTGLVLGALALLRLLRHHPAAWPWPEIARLKGYRAIVGLNADIMVRSLLLNLAFAVFTALSARIGDATLAANEVLMFLMAFSAYWLDGFANAAEALVGQAVGRGSRDDLTGAMRTASLWALATAGAACLLFAVAGGLIVRVMTDVEEVRQIAYHYLPYAVLLPLTGVWSYQLDGAFFGATRGRDIRNAMLVSVAIYVPAALALWQGLGNHGLWLALHLLLVLRAVTLAVRWPALVREAVPAAAATSPA